MAKKKDKAILSPLSHLFKGKKKVGLTPKDQGEHMDMLDRIQEETDSDFVIVILGNDNGDNSDKAAMMATGISPQNVLTTLQAMRDGFLKASDGNENVEIISAKFTDGRKK